MVGGRNACIVEVDVEVDASAARAAPDLNIRQGTSGLFDFLQILFFDADALGVAGQGVEIITEVA